MSTAIRKHPSPPPTLRELSQLIGSAGVLTVDRLNVPVVILDARASYGRVDVLVTPVGGMGERWAKLENVQVLRGPAQVAAVA